MSKQTFPPVAFLVRGLLCLLPFLLAGCGNRTIYPVEGQIVDKEDKPITSLENGTVVFESLEAKESAVGPIDREGRFRLTTTQAGDGARLGRHRVLITRPYLSADRQAPHVILEKYEKFEMSGLEEVVEAKDNQITLKVERVTRKK